MNYCEHQDAWDSVSSETQREKGRITAEANNLEQCGWEAGWPKACGQRAVSVGKSTQRVAVMGDTSRPF